MADFYQTGIVPTLHRLNENGLDKLERELAQHVRSTPVGLVLPALYSEFLRPAMTQIVRELRGARYLTRIVVALGQADDEQYCHARSFFEGFEVPVVFLRVDHPSVEDLRARLEARGIMCGPAGKGRSCWLAYGYMLACNDVDVIALHDCDIINYSRELLARLCYPVVHPELGFEFCKAYYARVSDKLYGRVTRLFFTPLVRAMHGMAPDLGFLRFIDSFRYALSGEFAMKSQLARVNRLPSDWGLEVGTLAEVYRNCAVSRVCQVDLADNYEHKHQELSQSDPFQGLRRMTVDIAKTLFRTLASEGMVFTSDHFRSLQVRYVRMAEDTINRYHADAMINGLTFDRHAEEMTVNAFTESLRDAVASFLENPLSQLLIPNWNRVLAAAPDFFGRLLAVVRETDSLAAVPHPAGPVRVAI
jgi:glucosyl-3-phosphoglycerate synthase